MVFMMYTQEYGAHCPQPNTRRVYISYVDSVRYFRSTPDGHRSTAYRSLLTSYFASCRRRGFEHVHVWVEPPRAGDEYIFYARPPEERRPMKREKLRSWYVRVLEASKEQGVVARFGSMVEEFRHIKSARQIPLFKGDQWELTLPEILKGDEPAPAAAEDDEDDTFRRPKLLSTARGRSGESTGSRSSPRARGGEASPAAAAPAGTDGRPQRLRGLALNKFAAGAASEDLVSKVHKQMRRLQGHFLVATLAPLSAEEGRAAAAGAEGDAEPEISHELVNTRQSLLHHCMSHALQFNSLRYAQYSTMMIVHEMLHPSSSSGTHYCLPGCKRGRVDDGSLMVACDVCDNWLHLGCLPPAQQPSTDDSFVCPLCVEAKADVYLQSEDMAMLSDALAGR